MLKGLLVGVSIAIVVLGVAWLFLSFSPPAETRVEYIPYPVTIQDSSQQEEVKRLSIENSNLLRQNSAVRSELALCQQRESFFSCDCPDSYDYDYNSHEWDLTVRVRDDDTGDPIEDVRVRVENGDSDVEYTDEDGEAFFSNLEEDCYDILVKADGYEDGTDDICIEDDERITIRLFQD